MKVIDRTSIGFTVVFACGLIFGSINNPGPLGILGTTLAYALAIVGTNWLANRKYVTEIREALEGFEEQIADKITKHEVKVSQFDRVKKSVDLAAVEETVSRLMRGITFYKEAEQYNLRTGRWLYDTYCEDCLSTTDHIDIAHGTCVVCKCSGNLSQERKYRVIMNRDRHVYYHFVYLENGKPRTDKLQSEHILNDVIYGKRLLNGKPREEAV